MDITTARLTVFFEDPFWVGVYERECGGRCQAAKVTFGAEPKDYDVLSFVQERWHTLSLSPPVRGRLGEDRAQNPKRAQREARRQTEGQGVGTKAQQALSLQREMSVLERKAASRERREEEAARDFTMRQQKKKEKHRGR